jgi:hypothetical protein
VAVADLGSARYCDPSGDKPTNGSRGEIDELFAGYGLLTGTDVDRLADGQLSSS